jgi:hypothetical protein
MVNSKEDGYEQIPLESLLMLNENVESELESQKKSSMKFYYHTRFSTAQKILKGTSENEEVCFYVSSLEKMNDRDEIELHEENKDNIFALCFSNTSAEIIPMWYLYSGITGEGVRIGITPNTMLALIQSIKEVFPVVEGKILKNNPLKKDIGFTLDYGWVYYCDEGKIKFRKNKYSLKDSDISEFKKNNFFIKTDEWDYEKEFRIVFDVKSVELTEGETFKQIALICDKKKLARGLSVTLAPEIKNQDENELANKLGITEDKIRSSKLHIRMNLIERNWANIANNFDKVVEFLNSQELNSVEETVNKRIQKRRKVLKEEKVKQESTKELTYV